MIKDIAFAVATSIIMAVAVPTAVSASSLGISPSSVKINIADGGHVTKTFHVHYYTGNMAVSPVNLPVTISPSNVVVSNPPESIDFIFTDATGIPGEYDGYVKFQASSNQTVALAVNIKAKVNIKPATDGGNGEGELSPQPTNIYYSGGVWSPEAPIYEPPSNAEQPPQEATPEPPSQPVIKPEPVEPQPIPPEPIAPAPEPEQPVTTLKPLPTQPIPEPEPVIEPEHGSKAWLIFPVIIACLAIGIIILERRRLNKATK